MTLEVSKGCEASSQMKQGPRAFSMFPIGDSDIHISCEESSEHAFEQLLGNPASFRVSVSSGPFALRTQIPCPTHIPIAERILLLRCLGKVGIPLESKPGNQLSCPVPLWYSEVFLIVAVTSWSL